MADFFDSREDFLRHSDHSDRFSIIQELFFEPFHERLLPLLMLEKSKNKILAKERQIADTRHFAAEKFAQASKDITVEEAYGMLTDHKPKNELQAMIQEYFMQHLPPALKMCGLPEAEKVNRLEPGISTISKGNLEDEDVAIDIKRKTKANSKII